jgi:hypothetical protein
VILVDAQAHAWAIEHPIYAGLIGIAAGALLVWLLFRWMDRH